jgi:hypothetical protein
MIESLFDWMPLLWTLRFAALIIIGATGLTVLLYALRFINPVNAWRLVTAKLPVFKEVGVRGNLMGQELAANAVLDIERDQQVRVLRAALDDLVDKHNNLADVVEDMRSDWR